MEVDIWEVDCCKEDIWSKLKAIEIFEVTNILLMVYSSEDRQSFERIERGYKEFKENNTVGAYKMLISIVSEEVQQRKTVKAVKKGDASKFMQKHGFSSYVEVQLETRTNIDILDLHTRYVMSPDLCNQRLSDMSMDELYMIVSRPLFETIPLLKAKKPVVPTNKITQRIKTPIRLS